jgi:hypothetical protein
MTAPYAAEADKYAVLCSTENDEQVVEHIEAVGVAQGVCTRCRVLVFGHFDDGKHRSILPDPRHTDLVSEPFVDSCAVCQVGGDTPPGARQSVHGKGCRKWLVQSGTKERDDCVTVVFLIGRQRALTVHPASMTRSPLARGVKLSAAGPGVLNSGCEA